MDPRPIDPHSQSAPSRQLVDQVLRALASGDLGPGEKLPSVRNLAVTTLVNPNTVGKAYRELELMGIVKGRNGSGVFVNADGPKKALKVVQASTLADFQAAAAAALAAGHCPAQLQDGLTALAAQQETDDSDPSTNDPRQKTSRPQRTRP